MDLWQSSLLVLEVLCLVACPAVLVRAVGDPVRDRAREPA